MRLSKQQVGLLNFLSNGGKAKVVNIPIVLIGDGDQVINWHDYLRLQQQGLIAEENQALVLTEQGRTLSQERQQCAKTVERMRKYKQLELV